MYGAAGKSTVKLSIGMVFSVITIVVIGSIILISLTGCWHRSKLHTQWIVCLYPFVSGTLEIKKSSAKANASRKTSMTCLVISCFGVGWSNPSIILSVR